MAVTTTLVDIPAGEYVFGDPKLLLSDAHYDLWQSVKGEAVGDVELDGTAHVYVASLGDPGAYLTIFPGDAELEVKTCTGKVAMVPWPICKAVHGVCPSSWAGGLQPFTIDAASVMSFTDDGYMEVYAMEDGFKQVMVLVDQGDDDEGGDESGSGDEECSEDDDFIMEENEEEEGDVDHEEDEEADYESEEETEDESDAPEDDGSESDSDVVPS